MTAPRFSIGIDLGTTNSVLAYAPLGDAPPADGSGEDGAPVAVLAIAQWATATTLVEQPVLPSFLYLPEDDIAAQILGEALREGDWIIGHFARTKAQEAPGRVAHSAKSWLCHHGADREAAFLPWGSTDIAAARKISPVRASALILNYLRAAWNDRFAGRGSDWAFDAQEITITVPASFDAAAQRLCLTAAEQAGYPETVRLLEEPQAAFYTWLARHGGEDNAWQALAQALEAPPPRTAVAAGAPEPDGGAAPPSLRHVLVVDIGGGTSDFSLFAVDGESRVRRIAVSEHILLGGDNIDLALAHALEAQLGGGEARLGGAQWDFLVARCRDLKEQALAQPGAADTVLQVAVPGLGSRLIAGARTAEITRGEVDRIILDGFFPPCAADAAPRRVAAALKEWGLPYASDSAITRHLARFLHGRPAVDAVLFNGGALYPEALRRRLSEQIGRWQGRSAVPVLANDEPDLAVARGAARFGSLVHSGRGRIAADAARAIFLEAQARATDDGDAARTAAKGQRLVCVLPRGAKAEEMFAIGNLALELRINRPVRFQAYASTRHGGARAGDLIAAGESDLQALPPLETTARVEHPPAGRRTIAVTLEAKLSELGLLQIACRSADPDLLATWPLDFNLRGLPTDVARSGTDPDDASAPVRVAPNAPAAALAAAGAVIERRFAQPAAGREGTGRDKVTAQRLLSALEKTLGIAKSEWNWVLVRSLWPSLEACADGRRRSPEHEETWLAMAGFLLRPGFGAAADEARIDGLWRILGDGPGAAGKRVKLQAYILWRRVAGGLSRARQEAVLAGEMNRIRRQDNLPPELVRMTGAFERLEPAIKAELSERYIERAAALARAGGHSAPFLAALGMLLNRAPFYAGPEDVTDPELVEQAYEAFAGLDWADPELAEMSTLFLRAARVVGNRSLDVRSSLRGKIAGRLEKLGIPPARTARLRSHMPIAAVERAGLFGEALPVGLILRDAE
ncbi:MAG: Hsp70 family protein [Rhodospirillales bacterium]|nr:Hsp70 family protein [Rhodospirillales bacterium]